jgi:hypothetical protein
MAYTAEFRKAASAAAKATLKLQKSTIDWPRPGYAKNLHGLYWPERAVEELAELLRVSAKLAPPPEDRSTFISIMTLMLHANRLDEAESIGLELLGTDDSVAVLFWVGLVAAARGDRSRAKDYSMRIASQGYSGAYSLSEVVIDQYFEMGSKLRARPWYASDPDGVA